jgi:purine-nucleoside phosphorylase
VRSELAYGELRGRALRWAARFGFGLSPASMPSTVVITPLKVEECFEGFRSTLNARGLEFKRVGSGFLVWNEEKSALFCEGGTGASNFADSCYVLCHCGNVEEILFVGTGGGIGERVETGDVNVPPSCIRLDKVLEILLPPEAPANADEGLWSELRLTVEKAVASLGITVHGGVHATVPFFLSETRELLTRLQGQGVVSVDMELSVLYALAGHYKKKAAGVVRIGDLPLKGLPTWKSRSYKMELKREAHRMILKSMAVHIFEKS